MSHAQVGDSLYAIEATELSAILGGQKVLEIPSLRVKSNEVLMVIGPNGSGKSTLLLCLALLLKPAAGTIAYQGIPVLDSNRVLQLHRRLAVVFQEPLLLNSTVWDNVTLGLRLRSVRGDEASARAKKWLERFGIAPLAKRQARTLSGGEAKRVSLARAFVLQPEVLFLDEPFTALDSPTRQALLEDFESVLRETRVTTVMVTHDRNEALVLADRVAVLMDGSIKQLGTPEEVFGSPVDEAVAKFVGIENILPGKIVGQDDNLLTIDVRGHFVQAVSGYEEADDVYVLIRPEDITFSFSRDMSSARNAFHGIITRLTPIGPLTRIEVDCGFPLLGVVTKSSASDLGFEVGKEIIATFKATATHIIKRWS